MWVQAMKNNHCVARSPSRTPWPQNLPECIGNDALIDILHVYGTEVRFSIKTIPMDIAKEM